jgi:hypothetical protein
MMFFCDQTTCVDRSNKSSLQMHLISADKTHYNGRLCQDLHGGFALFSVLDAWHSCLVPAKVKCSSACIMILKSGAAKI